MHPLRLPAVLGSLLFLIGCSQRERVDAGGPVARDSAGVRIITLYPPTDTFRVVSSLGVVAGTEERPIGFLRDATFVDQETLAIADGYERSVLLIDLTTRGARSFGRGGEGPGEFTEIHLLQVTDEGILVFDPMKAKLTLFDMEGVYVRQQEFRPILAEEGLAWDGLQFLGVLDGRLTGLQFPYVREADGDVAWGRTGIMIEGEPGEYRQLLEFRKTRCVDESEIKNMGEIARLTGREDWCPPDQAYRSGAASISGHAVFVLPADRPEGYLLLPDGRVSTIVRALGPSDPFTDRVFLDQQGSIWLGLSNGEWRRIRPAEGRVDLITLPEGAYPLDAISDKVALMRRDRLNVITVDVVTISNL